MVSSSIVTEQTHNEQKKNKLFILNYIFYKNKIHNFKRDYWFSINKTN